MNEDIKLKRQLYLQEVLRKYTNTEPKLSIKEIAIVLSFEFDGEIVNLLKEVIKENKKL